MKALCHWASTLQIEAVQGQLVRGFCGAESPVLIPSQPSQSPRDPLSGYIWPLPSKQDLLCPTTDYLPSPLSAKMSPLWRFKQTHAGGDITVVVGGVWWSFLWLIPRGQYWVQIIERLPLCLDLMRERTWKKSADREVSVSAVKFLRVANVSLNSFCCASQCLVCLLAPHTTSLCVPLSILHTHCW